MKNCAAAAPAAWSIHDLKPSERLVLWSLRYWTACKRQSKPCGDLLREVYANNGMTGAASQLGALMDLVSATALKPPGIRCTACPLLSADERAILDAVASAAETPAEGGRRYPGTLAAASLCPDCSDDDRKFRT